jgi:hypothetical protein
MSKTEAEADHFTGIAEALLNHKRFGDIVRRAVTLTLSHRNEVMPVDDAIARLVYYHGLREVVRALANAASAHGELPAAGKLRAMMPQLPTQHAPPEAKESY